MSELDERVLTLEPVSDVIVATPAARQAAHDLVVTLLGAGRDYLSAAVAIRVQLARLDERDLEAMQTVLMTGTILVSNTRAALRSGVSS